MSDNEKPLRLPACASCARRKTKCDRNSPCSSCVAAKVQCRYAQKRLEKKRRVLHSSRYEESLTHISHQLEALSNTLQSFAENNRAVNQQVSSNDASSTASPAVRGIAGLPYHKAADTVSDSRDYEGESSFHSQSKRVADILSQSVIPLSDNTADAQATAVGIVQALIQDANAANSPLHDGSLSQSTSETFSHHPDLANLSLPPMDSVLRLLAFAKESPHKYFLKFPHTNEEEFANLCQKLYFPTQPFTVFAWIKANCGLYYLFRDLDKLHYDKLHLINHQISDAVALCSSNIDRAVRSLKLCINPSLEAIDALVLAATVNMENANGSLAWKLASAAARMSIDLGYHRLPSGYGDEQRSQKRKLFWYVYAMDMSLAFNFGRSPTLQDYDVTTERPTYPDDFRGEWGSTFLEYIDFTLTQHDIYKQLFSAKAQQEPLQVRVQRAHELAARLLQVKDSFTKALNKKDVEFRDAPFEAVHSIDIGFCSILTLVYRVLPPDDTIKACETASDVHHPLQFHRLCVEAGRAALNALVDGWNVVSTELDGDGTKIFMNWTLLLFPFMPYLAVFGNQITTNNQEDLVLLKKVVQIVETTADSSNAMNKLYNALSRLLKIAELCTNTSSGRKSSTIENLHTQPLAVANQGSQFPTTDTQSSSNGTVMDVEMMAPTATDTSPMVWKDLNMTQQDWDEMFNEFDFGLGAESAREMMPWFEQLYSA